MSGSTIGHLSKVVTGTDMVMRSLGNKLSRGLTLNSGETLIPITVGAHAANYAYGPDMAPPPSLSTATKTPTKLRERPRPLIPSRFRGSCASSCFPYVNEENTFHQPQQFHLKFLTSRAMPFLKKCDAI